VLVCPVCAASFTLTGQSLRCATGHSFDVARQGYVNLMPGGTRPGTADTAEMVAARADFLGAGHYAPLAEAVAGLAVSARAGAGAGVGAGAGADVVLDAGAGTGYYLAAVLRALRSAPGAEAGAGGGPVAGLAMDISARALRRAARAGPGIGAVAWDTWQPFPVRSGTVSLILNVFAPRNAAEFHRVLRPGGTLIVVTPAGTHLAELIAPASLLTVDDDKDSRLSATLGPYFTQAARRTLTIPLHLTRPEAATLIAMGPSAHHSTPAATQTRLAALPAPLEVTASFDITRYHPKRTAAGA
jgi:23S rRNA (guanine745-N1)-methyltransferase